MICSSNNDLVLHTSLASQTSTQLMSHCIICNNNFIVDMTSIDLTFSSKLLILAEILVLLLKATEIYNPLPK
ncbi:hypothetical protein BC952_1832 [Flavobacterium limicola]|uniref:Uncharacterized protein n=1 Tax=Flavobacterium limicola TaxID=180441 RepID=A0A495S2D7_9FLAO|nr:hypothetical protein BC952_1832 [Flavobacterium limicola]